MLFKGFNLGIERLFISSEVQIDYLHHVANMFQSRNRETFHFKEPSNYTQIALQLFQSRNRETFHFKTQTGTPPFWSS